MGKYLLPHLELSQLIEKIAINPRKILGIDQATLSEGNIANITLFNPLFNPFRFVKILSIFSTSLSTYFILVLYNLVELRVVVLIVVESKVVIVVDVTVIINVIEKYGLINLRSELGILIRKITLTLKF